MNSTIMISDGIVKMGEATAMIGIVASVKETA